MGYERGGREVSSYHTAFGGVDSGLKIRDSSVLLGLLGWEVSQGLAALSVVRTVLFAGG